jgi:hypothetical protein
VTSGITQLQFSDGSTVNLGGAGNMPTFTWLGSVANFNITGTTFGTNVYEVTASGHINFANNSAVGGTNTIKFDKGVGLADVTLNGGMGTISFGSNVVAHDVYWQGNAYGDLILKIRGDTTDGLTIHNDLTSSSGVVASGITQLQFSDGSTVNLGGAGNMPTFTWLGSVANFNITGTTFGTNVYEVTASGHINFADASPVGGTNIVKFDKGDGLADVTLNGGMGTISFGSNVVAHDVYWQGNAYGDLILKIRGDTTDGLTIHNDLVTNSWGVSSGITQLSFMDGTTIDLGRPAAGTGAPLTFTWIGSPNSSIGGSGFGANTFEMGVGAETFTGGSRANGGSGNNTYFASTDTGQATIYPNEAAGSINELDFAAGITDENLWFVQSGNDLAIDLLGTNTSVTIKGWFSSTSNQLQEIEAGGLKIDSQISQLVQAMAAYSANNTGFNPTDSGIHTLPSDTALQNAIGAAWHA